MDHNNTFEIILLVFEISHWWEGLYPDDLETDLSLSLWKYSVCSFVTGKCT